MAQQRPHPKAAQKTLFIVFALLGMMNGLWAASIPLLQKRLNLTADILGLSMFCFALGAVLATFVVPRYILRHSTRWVMMASATIMWLSFPLMLDASSLSILLPINVAVGFGFGAMDASMNSHAFNVEHFLQKPSMSFFHAGWSVGTIIGSAAVAAVLYLNMPYIGSIYAICFSALALIWTLRQWCYGQDIQTSVSGDTSNNHTRMPSALIIIAIITALSFFTEGAISDWAGLFLRDDKSASPTQTALSLAAFSVGMTFARFRGDAWRARFSILPLLRASCAGAALATLAFIASPNAVLALLCLMIVGLFSANIVPLLFVRAGNIKGVPAARGVAYVAGMGYASLLGGPALLGYLAHHWSLSASFLIVVSCNVVLFLEAHWRMRQLKSMSHT